MTSGTLISLRILVDVTAWAIFAPLFLVFLITGHRRRHAALAIALAACCSSNALIALTCAQEGYPLGPQLLGIITIVLMIFTSIIAHQRPASTTSKFMPYVLSVGFAERFSHGVASAVGMKGGLVYGHYLVGTILSVLAGWLLVHVESDSKSPKAKHLRIANLFGFMGAVGFVAMIREVVSGRWDHDHTQHSLLFAVMILLFALARLDLARNEMSIAPALILITDGLAMILHEQPVAGLAKPMHTTIGAFFIAAALADWLHIAVPIEQMHVKLALGRLQPLLLFGAGMSFAFATADVAMPIAKAHLGLFAWFIGIALIATLLNVYTLVWRMIYERLAASTLPDIDDEERLKHPYSPLDLAHPASMASAETLCEICVDDGSVEKLK